MSHLRRLAIVTLVAMTAATAGCRLKSEKKTSTTTTTSAESESTSTKRIQLEGRVGYGKTWGSDDRAKRAAKAVQNALEEEGGIDRSEIGVAVQAVPGKLVAVVKLKYLKEEGRTDRKILASFIHHALGEHAKPDEEIVFGVRGALLYGIVGSGKPLGQPKVSVGSSVKPDEIEEALAL